MKAFLEQKEVLFYSHTVNILRKKLPKRGHMPVYLGRTQKITTLIYILLCGFQMVWYTLSHLMNIILLIFHTTFEATEAQRIPYPITSNRGVRSPDPIITAFFYSVRAHTTQRKPSELVHKISPLGISLLKVKKKTYFRLCWVFGAMQVFLGRSEQGLPFIAVGVRLTVEASFVAENGQLQLSRQVDSGGAILRL